MSVPSKSRPYAAVIFTLIFLLWAYIAGVDMVSNKGSVTLGVVDGFACGALLSAALSEWAKFIRLRSRHADRGSLAPGTTGQPETHRAGTPDPHQQG